MVGSTLPMITEIQGTSADRGVRTASTYSRYARPIPAMTFYYCGGEGQPAVFYRDLFGELGVGQELLMRLMIEHTRKISAFDDVGQDGKRMFCRTVVSIPFNAWHYAESELPGQLWFRP